MKVNLTVDFLNDKTGLNYLFLGHKPTSVMIDARSEQNFAELIACKGAKTLKTDFFTNHPIFVRKIETKNQEWRPSVHRLGNMILCAFADEIETQIDTSYGLDKKKFSVKVSGSYVSLMLCSS